MGDSRIHIFDWLERKISSITGEYSYGTRIWNLLDEQVGLEWLVRQRFEDFQYDNLDLCFECFYQKCCERFLWDSQLLKDGFFFTDHRNVKAVLEGIEDRSGEWRELFLEFIRQNASYRIDAVVGEDAKSRDCVLSQLKELAVTPLIAREVIEWYERFRNEPIEFEEFLELVSNGYKSTDDLRRLEHDLNKRSYGFTVPPIDLLRRIEGGINRFFKLDNKLDRVLGWYGDLELGVRSEEIVNFLDLGLTEACLDSIEQVVARELKGNEYMFYKDEVEEDGFAPFRRTLEAIEAVGLPISDTNVSQYFGMSSASILFAIDNELSDEKYFACARLFDEVSDIQKGVSILEICQDLQATCDLVKAGLTPEILDAVEAIGVSVATLTELVKKEPQFPCAALLLWLDAGFEADSLDEMLEWWRAGFTPANVASWRELGFDALEATAWLRHTSDPVVAWRRKEAGISPTKK